MYNSLKFLLVAVFIIITATLKAQHTFALKGKVTTVEGKALKNITVSLFGKNFKGWSITVTDSSGNYALASVCNGDTLYFSALGIESKRIVVEGNNYILARVQQAVNYRKGVVVEGKVDSIKTYPLQQRKVNFFHYDAIGFKPLDGWAQFESQIKKELKYPAVAIENQTQGVVIVSLTIANTGDVEDFKIIKGIGSGCDEEVLRIMKLHPKWIPCIENGHPIGGEIEYSITFNLKEK
jgi:TonB family protein